MDRTCDNLGQVLRRVVTPWWATSPFLGLFLRNQTIGLGIGVDTFVVCQVSSPVSQRSHIQRYHLLRSGVAEVEPCLELCSGLRVRVERHGKRDVLRGVGLGVGE